MDIECAQYCINCRKPTNRHRPWCDKVQTITPSKEGDVVDDPMFGPTELISVYSRAQAIEDGVLIDCTEEPFDQLNRDAHVSFDVAMTSTAFHRYVEVPEQYKTVQDIKGRYWDIIWAFCYAARIQRLDGNELLFEFLCLVNETERNYNEQEAENRLFRLVQLKAVAADGDRGEPCLTFMLPNED